MVLTIYLEFAKFSERKFEVGRAWHVSVPSKLHIFIWHNFCGLFIK